MTIPSAAVSPVADSHHKQSKAKTTATKDDRPRSASRTRANSNEGGHQILMSDSHSIVSLSTTDSKRMSKARHALVTPTPPKRLTKRTSSGSLTKFQVSNQLLAPTQSSFYRTVSSENMSLSRKASTASLK